MLSGGGALGAYEVGVLRVLEAVGFRPAVLAGVSIGAINAVVWRAHDGRTRPLEDVWRRITPADVGFRWVTLLLRALGGVIAVVGLFELVLTLAGSRELSGSHWLWHRASARLDLASTVLDLWMWGLFTMAGISAALFSRQVETWLARRRPGSVSRRTWWRAGRVLLGLWLVYGVVWLGGFPWPHRFTVSVLAVATLLWVANRPGQSNRWARLLLHAFLPETRGRGLWSAAARKRMVELLVAAGDRRRLVDPDACLILSALALDTGRTTHFVSGGRPDDDFARRLAEELGEVVVVRDPADVQVAALASSAIPGIFEPERLIGRDFVDAGGFTNQPLHVALAAGADAVLVVLLSPSGSPAPAPPPESLFALAGRLLELANWRDMQTELRSLPPEWLSAQSPARLCVVEPDSALPGGVLGFDPAQAGGLIARGEEDAWRALERAGWLERCAAENASAL
ncbi:MAG TPA: patatin-like phospholipase family protein [Terriglobales bacterium]|nr:patatin-like phospholipase family protein [Terriglobales bacterium]